MPDGLELEEGRDLPGALIVGGAAHDALDVLGGEALELGRALGRAPRRVVLLGVEGAAFAMGDPLTPSVEAALEEVVAEALGELR